MLSLIVMSMALSDFSSQPEKDIKDQATEISPRRFALLPHIFFDLDSHAFYNRISFQNLGLIYDCSDDQWNCLHGHNVALNLNWSRQCGPYNVGQSWTRSKVGSSGPLTMSVVAEYLVGTGLKRPRYLVRSSLDSQRLFIFADSDGLIGVIQDGAIPIDGAKDRFKERLRDGSLVQALEDDPSSLEDENFFSSYLKFEKIGTCNKMSWEVIDGVQRYKPIPEDTGN